MNKYFLVAFIGIVVTLNIIIIRNIYVEDPGRSLTIKVDEGGFNPRSLSIVIGEKVTFENVGKELHWPASNIHPTHGIYPEFDLKRGIKPGEKWSFEFDKAGTWKMHDHLYPEFTGVINVEGAKLLSDKNNSFIETIMGLWGKKNENDGKYDPEIARDDNTISDDERALYSYVKKFGPEKAVKQLFAIDSAMGVDCHDDAHTLGRYSYQIYGTETFGMCSAECHSGCYHGATEAFFKEHGTADLEENLKIVCGGFTNDFFSHQCIHGIGHGLTAYNDYEILNALSECDLLSEQKASCYSGVFMENIVGALVKSDSSSSDTKNKHITKYLNTDPQYPCNILDEKYKSACYFYQTSRMVQLFNFDFEKVAEECGKVPIEYQQACYESMGRDVGGYTYNDPEKSIKLCGSVPPGQDRIDCLEGAVQNTFWDPSGADIAIRFCKTIVDKEEKNACYLVISDRAKYVLSNKAEMEKFCRKAEEGYNEYCEQVIGYKK